MWPYKYNKIEPFKLYNHLGLCRNLSFGLVTKAKACDGAGQERSPGVTFHASGSVGECERINLHTRPSTPEVLWAENVPQVFLFPLFSPLDSKLSPSMSLGVCQVIWCIYLFTLAILKMDLK
jgi:hypothetical protein